jgi:hypothetical protein
MQLRHTLGGKVAPDAWWTHLPKCPVRQPASWSSRVTVGVDGSRKLACPSAALAAQCTFKAVWMLKRAGTLPLMNPTLDGEQTGDAV